MLRQAVVFLMSANPFPKEAVFYEMPDSAVMDAHARRPVFAAQFLELQRRMARVLFPEDELFVGEGLNSLRQSFQTAAKLAAAERFYGHSSVNPAW